MSRQSATNLLYKAHRTDYHHRNSSEAADYLKTYFFRQTSASDLNQLLTLYPSDITQGSPFGTSTNNAVTPQFKRLAALQGDLLFQAPRRFFLQQRSGRQNAWSYCRSYNRDSCTCRADEERFAVSKRFKDSEDIGSVSMIKTRGF